MGIIREDAHTTNGYTILSARSETFSMSYFKAKLNQIRFRLQLHPTPHWGAHGAPSYILIHKNVKNLNFKIWFSMQVTGNITSWLGQMLEIAKGPDLLILTSTSLPTPCMHSASQTHHLQLTTKYLSPAVLAVNFWRRLLTKILPRQYSGPQLPAIALSK